MIEVKITANTSELSEAVKKTTSSLRKLILAISGYKIVNHRGRNKLVKV